MPGFNMILYISTDKQYNMKTKKIITLLLIIAIFCSITAVSAGWFDFLSGGEKQDEEQTTAETQWSVQTVDKRTRTTISLINRESVI